jgi:hypothetical protein
MQEDDERALAGLHVVEVDPRLHLDEAVPQL